MNQQNKKAIAIDGNCLMYRFFYATQSLVSKYKKNSVVATNALDLFIRSILKLRQKENYTYGLIAFDSPGGSFRNQQFIEYKTNRKGMPDDLFDQVPLIHKAAELMGFYIGKKAGYEADDLIGSFSHLLNTNMINVDIYSTDQDMLQLINEYTSLNVLKKGVSEILKIDFDNFKINNLSVIDPSFVTTYKALAGDSSDNIPGVNGIGQKLANEIINKYGSIENLYSKVNEWTFSDRIKNALINYKNKAFVYRTIATITVNCYDNVSAEAFVLKPVDIVGLKQMCEKFNLYKLLEFINKWEEI